MICALGRCRLSVDSDKHGPTQHSRAVEKEIWEATHNLQNVSELLVLLVCLVQQTCLCALESQVRRPGHLPVLLVSMDVEARHVYAHEDADGKLRAD